MEVDTYVTNVYENYSYDLLESMCSFAWLVCFVHINNTCVCVCVCAFRALINTDATIFAQQDTNQEK